MGHMRAVTARVLESSSTRYREALLSAPGHVSSRMRALEAQVKERWCITVLNQFSQVERIPHSAVAAFAQYCGHDKS